MNSNSHEQKQDLVGEALTKIKEQFEYIGGTALLVIAPNLVARFTFALVRRYLPIWSCTILVIIYFVLLLAWAWLISGDRGGQLFSQLYRRGVKWPVLFSVAMLVFALIPFAGLTSLLVDTGYSLIDPPIPKAEFWRLEDLYLWHFLNSIPGLKIPETLLWKEPFTYRDRLTGALLLTYKLVVITPVIASFAVWRRLKKSE